MSTSKGDVYVLHDFGTQLPLQNTQTWPIFLHTLKESLSLGCKTHCKNFQAQGEGFVYKVKRENDQNLGKDRGGLATLPLHGIKLQNESWLHSAKTSVFFQTSETAPQADNTLPTPGRRFFSRILLRDASTVSVRVYIRTHQLQARKGRLKFTGLWRCTKRKITQRRLPCRIPAQGHISQSKAAQVPPTTTIHFYELKLPVTHRFEQ